ncbi:MAG TPA: DUF3597 domain-containing protein [Hyphomicrobium sp.]|jgi:hypothetical protein
MSILGSIMSGIFGGPAHAETMPPSVINADAKSASTAAAGEIKAPVTDPVAHAATALTDSVKSIDIAANLDKLTAGNKDLDWRKSIVDLMKTLKLDSSIAARKKLAAELHYTGNTKDTAAMNTWLHQQVMAKLAENGGKVPKDVLHS